MVVKTLPTREGQGSLWTEELTQKEMASRGVVEYSSIGGAIRRKGFGINWEMLAYATELNGATQIALTFCEHYDPKVKNIKTVDGITDRLWQLIEKVRVETGVPVTVLNTGKPYNSIVDLTGEEIDWEEVEKDLILPKEK